MRENYYDLEDKERKIVDVGIEWLGFRPHRREDIDICTDGSVWVGLTMVCPKGTITD